MGGRTNKALYVQYGCGASCPEGWTNFDSSPTLRLQRLPALGMFFKRGTIAFHERVRFGDIVKGLPLPDGAARGVYASHVLEHLSLTDFWIALSNTLRLLEPGGIFRLIVPDLEVRANRYLQMLNAGDTEANCWFMRHTHLGIENRQRGLEGMLRSVFGNSSHLWMWDERSMIAALRKAGFDEIRRCRLGDCRDEAFRLVEDVGRFVDAGADLEECAIEAIKPTTR